MSRETLFWIWYNAKVELGILMIALAAAISFTIVLLAAKSESKDDKDVPNVFFLAFFFIVVVVIFLLFEGIHLAL